jgi:hypothetical protein
MDPERELYAVVQKFMKLSRKHPVILTLDGHYSHLRNIEVIDCAREMHTVCFPLHSTHKLQRVGVSFMQPLKTYYTQEIEIWLKNHPKELLHTIKLLDWFGKVYLKLATAAIAANGFQKTCFSPCNCHIFDEHDAGRISAHHKLFA